jgi:hypothetical protein
MDQDNDEDWSEDSEEEMASTTKSMPAASHTTPSSTSGANVIGTAIPLPLATHIPPHNNSLPHNMVTAVMQPSPNMMNPAQMQQFAMMNQHNMNIMMNQQAQMAQMQQHAMAVHHQAMNKALNSRPPHLPKANYVLKNLLNGESAYVMPASEVQSVLDENSRLIVELTDIPMDGKNPRK